MLLISRPFALFILRVTDRRVKRDRDEGRSLVVLLLYSGVFKKRGEAVEACYLSSVTHYNHIISIIRTDIHP